MSKVEWVDLTDIQVERGIMSVIDGGTYTESQICKMFSRAGFITSVDHIFAYYLSNLVKKGYLKKQKEGGNDYFWRADRLNPFASTRNK